jgi:hypothetical protein
MDTPHNLQESSMNPLAKAAALSALIGAGVYAVPDMTQIGVDQAITEIMTQLNSAKVAGLGAVAIAIQALMLFFRTKLSDFAGKYRMLAVYGLSVAGGIVAMRAQGLSWAAAALHSNTLGMAQIFAHQVYKQFYVKEE